MGNCLILAASPCLSSFSSSSSSRFNSLCSISSFESSVAISSSPATPILPFSTLSDLGAQYKLGRTLGRGQFGLIRLCTCRTSNSLFACKSISKLRMKRPHDILPEVRIMQLLSQLPSLEATRPDIVRLHQVIEDGSHVHLIMELCDGGELFDRIVKKKCCQESQAAAIIKSLMESIQVCHRMGVMHRDIKPENILLLDASDSSPIRLADFGLALEFSPGEKFSGKAGSSYYIAPEVLQGEYSEEIDVWSAGVVLYVILSGEPPFWGATEKDIFKAIRKGNLEFPSDPWMPISFSAKDLISKMLCADVKARLTPAQVLEHPWILQHTKAAKQALQPHCQKSTNISNALALKTHELDTQKVLAVSSVSPTSSDDIDQEKVTRVSAAQTPCSSPTVHVEEDEQKSALHTKTFSNVMDQTLQKSALHTRTVGNMVNQTLQAVHVDTSVKDALLMAFVAKFDFKCLTMPELLAQFLFQQVGVTPHWPHSLHFHPLKNLQTGLSCALFSVSPTERMFAVEVGKKSYLISYNSRRKMGLKILGQHHKGRSSSLHVMST